MKLPWRREQEALDPEARGALIATLVKRPCAHCGGWHPTACPRVKSMQFTASGKEITAVEFWHWDDVDWSNTVWLHDLNPTEDELKAIPNDPLDGVPPGWHPLLAAFSTLAAANAAKQGPIALTGGL